MAHEVESMFYVSNEANGRFKPWHGLGEPVQEALTSADAIKRAGLDWEVRSDKLLLENGIEVPGYKANVRATDNSVLGVVTDRYKIVQNSEAFDFTDALIGEGVTYETAGSLSNGKRVWLLAKMPESKILGDDFDNYICFTNSHDGNSAIRVCMTPIRVVCNNTLNLALSSAKRSWSTKHAGNMQAKLAEARFTLQLANEYLEALAVEAEKLANIRVTRERLEEVLNEMFPICAEDSERKAANAQAARDAFWGCYYRSDIAKFRDTVWGAVNAASDFATHTAPARATPTYRENNWTRTMDGHVIIDTMLLKLLARAKA